LVFKMDNKVISGGFEEETFKIIDIKSWWKVEHKILSVY
jgi:hypothetical protein